MEALVYVVAALIVFVLLILWILLPFAVFGTKDKLNELIEETRRSNQALKALVNEMRLLREQQG